MRALSCVRYSKVLALLYLTLALVWLGGLGIFAVTGESLYDAFWQVLCRPAYQCPLVPYLHCWVLSLLHTTHAHRPDIPVGLHAAHCACGPQYVGPWQKAICAVPSVMITAHVAVFSDAHCTLLHHGQYCSARLAVLGTYQQLHDHVYACVTALLQAIAGVGIDWTFAEDAVKYGGLPVRATAVAVSLGGLLVTALMLGIVSGAALGPTLLWTLPGGRGTMPACMLASTHLLDCKLSPYLRCRLLWLCWMPASKSAFMPG